MTKANSLANRFLGVHKDNVLSTSQAWISGKAVVPFGTPWPRFLQHSSWGTIPGNCPWEHLENSWEQCPKFLGTNISWCGPKLSRFSGRGWGQQLFSFQSPAVHWIARTSSLNCLSCRNPYQTPHFPNFPKLLENPKNSSESVHTKHHTLRKQGVWFFFGFRPNSSAFVQFSKNREKWVFQFFFSSAFSGSWFLGFVQNRTFCGASWALKLLKLPRVFLELVLTLHIPVQRGGKVWGVGVFRDRRGGAAIALRLLNALNSEDRGLKVRFSLATIVFETFELILCQMLSSQGKNAPSNPYPHYLVRLATSRWWKTCGFRLCFHTVQTRAFSSLALSRPCAPPSSPGLAHIPRPALARSTPGRGPALARPSPFADARFKQSSRQNGQNPEGLKHTN